MAARNMQRKEINIYEKELCVNLVIYKDYTEMHGQQNIKNCECDTVNFVISFDRPTFVSLHSGHAVAHLVGRSRVRFPAVSLEFFFT